MIKLDYSQHQCPYPVIETRKQMLENPGIILEVKVGDQAGRDNVSRLADKMGYQAQAQAQATGFTLTLTPEQTSEQQTDHMEPVPLPAKAASVVYCSSASMGSGSDELGQLLMKNFLMTLLEMDPLPSHILFVNAGVKLTTDTGELREILQKLAERGIDLASCGLCLDFFHLKDQLQVGRITNMYEIVDLQNNAARIIIP